jgi:hypothetical protein
VPERFFSNQSSKTSDRSNHNHQSNQPIEQRDQSSFRDMYAYPMRGLLRAFTEEEDGLAHGLW